MPARTREGAPAGADPLSLHGLPGVGPKTAARLAEQGIESLEDLARLLPLGYRDRRRRSDIDAAEDGAQVVVEAEIRRFSQRFFRGRFFASMECVQREGARERSFVCQWFHRVGGLAERAKLGRRVLLIGRVTRKGARAVLVHPELHDPDAPGPGITVRYPELEGLGEATVARLCRTAVERLAARLVDPAPPELLVRHGLMPLVPALQLLHAPGEDLPEAALVELQEGRSPAHRRLLFDALLAAQLGVLQRRAQAQSAPVTVTLLPGEGDRRERLRACAPFEPTRAQWQAIEEIEADLQRGRPMLRLLQGDVGSGKTLVAFAACLGIVDSGGQAALMAPTEILAQQHFAALRPWCAAAGVRAALLTGATPRAERTRLLGQVAGGALDLVVGTHALLTEDVAFRRLGLVVIDEQHRFGVRQRALLRGKGPAPHLLVMTATPIPRTLALSLYGELDASVLRELPPGRRPPETTLVAGPGALERARTRLAELVRREGLRAFVVCPQIEAGAREASDVEAAAAAFRALLPDRAIGVLTGRMDAEAKSAAMAAFRAGALDVLVATTVIEVGVDVPEARAILVEHAEHFGLAQLHQLRGRIGRGEGRAWCLLHTAAEARSAAAERLKILVETSDGFRVAEHDLGERGSGELFGLRQAGRSPLDGLAGEGTRLLEAARAAARELLAEDPELRRHPGLRAAIDRQARQAALLAGDAG